MKRNDVIRTAFVAVIIMLLTAAAFSADWELQNPIPRTFNGAWGTSPTNVYIVGDGGSISLYNGTGFDIMNSGTSENLSAVWGRSDTDVYAVGGVGTVLKYNGSFWASMGSIGTSASLRGVWGAPGGELFVVGGLGYSSMYNGTDWTFSDINGSGDNQNMFDVWGASASEVFAVGGNGEIYFYNGTSWDPMNSGFTGNQLYGVWGNSASEVFAVGGAGRAVFYNGTAWYAMNSGTTQVQFNDVWGTSASNVYAVSTKGEIYHYDGNASLDWTQEAYTAPNDLNGLYVDGSGDALAVGECGMVAQYTSSTWFQVGDIAPTCENLYAVWSSPTDDLFAVGEMGTIMAYNGMSWESMDSGIASTLKSVWGTASDDIYAVGGVGVSPELLYYNGTSWDTMTPPGSQAFYRVWGLDATHVFASDNNGGVFFYNGVDWTSMAMPGSGYAVHDIWGMTSNALHAVGSQGTILFYNGTSWDLVSPSPTNRNLYGVWGPSADNIYAVGDWLTVVNYNGTSWEEVSTGLTHGPVSLYDVWGTSAGDIYAAGAGGYILNYNGTDWTKMDVPVNTTCRGIGGGVTVAGDGGAILYLDRVSPVVNSVSPADGATGVSPFTSVSATFSEEVDPLSVNDTTFTLSVLGVPVPATVAVNGTTATLTPDPGLIQGTTYTAILNASISDKADNILGSDYIWSFTTLIPGTGGGGGGGGGGGSACFIATAAYGSPMASEVDTLREFRDRVLLKNGPGRAFVNMYYTYSPPVASFIARHESLRTATRAALTPIVYSVKYPYAALLFMAAVLAWTYYGWRRKRRSE